MRQKCALAFAFAVAKGRNSPCGTMRDFGQGQLINSLIALDYRPLSRERHPLEEDDGLARQVCQLISNREWNA
jgi:hypothetical protein